jgi:hypothetical protein
MLEGGHDYDGREFMPFDETGMRAAARQIREESPRPCDWLAAVA